MSGLDSDGRVVELGALRSSMERALEADGMSAAHAAETAEVLLDAELEELEVITRLNGEESQRGRASEMTWGIVELLVYASRMMTLERGDLLLTGTPAGVGSLGEGDRLEVEIPGVGVLENRVETRRPG